LAKKWIPKFHYRVHNTPALGSIPGHPFHTITTYQENVI